MLGWEPGHEAAHRARVGAWAQGCTPCSGGSLGTRLHIVLGWEPGHEARIVARIYLQSKRSHCVLAYSEQYTTCGIVHVDTIALAYAYFQYVPS